MAAAAPNIDEPQRADQLRRRANRRLLGASVLLLIAIVAVAYPYSWTMLPLLLRRRRA